AAAGSRWPRGTSPECAAPGRFDRRWCARVCSRRVRSPRAVRNRPWRTSACPALCPVSSDGLTLTRRARGVVPDHVGRTGRAGQLAMRCPRCYGMSWYGTLGGVTVEARIEHVGSLLRPRFLRDAREAYARAELTPAEFKSAEDRAVREIV